MTAEDRVPADMIPADVAATAEELVSKGWPWYEALAYAALAELAHVDPFRVSEKWPILHRRGRPAAAPATEIDAGSADV